MGKRKSSSKPVVKAKVKLDTAFDCLFCNHEKSVAVKIDKKSSIGDLRCKICGQNHQCRTDALSQPIDVYSDWIDACDEVKDKGGVAEGPDDYDEE
ncbi:protein of unknown function [Taphrina deformans PYCC 5710]|uniref:Transcription elongation factor 1 homolog n=1 Tax=Taphrina deformans (strain PYCC 5710 / ATCC 11124 / CBS 356.35 / IMI 108563 / JCM 9778 / NBRC 8474) TaxID=1097556 RepID=R4XFE6_TAPDE|nr:protein of unknown function [Taphrina deformans PYCC 5710]|eukprot:CCG84393.1 protein of unknown function [Taphrina deformans PYCC 5710]